MSWVSVKGGYLIQCDQCGYIRGSLFAADGVQNAAKRGRGKQPFREKRRPDQWRDWLQGGEDVHLCPECNARRLR